jgi:poly-gamma-glutamate capsule biosynthesis protein CapA/YwtB (metallophosphatase superfamily)
VGRHVRNVAFLAAGLAGLAVAGCGGHSATPDRPVARTGGPVAAPPSPAKPRDITVAFAGDVHFEKRTVARLTEPAPALGPISQTLGAADVSLVNLETAITTRGTPEPKQWHFRAPPAALGVLQASGVKVVTMANNHAADYGAVGVRDSLAAIGTSPIPVIGFGADSAAAYRPYVADVRGTKIALIAASQIHDRTMAAWKAGPGKPGIASALDTAALVGAVRQARQQGAQAVIVYVHWGTEGSACPNSEQKALAARLAGEGVTAVVGTHAHQLLGAGTIGGTYVAYGYGNFLWHLDNAYSNDTGVDTITIRAGKVVAERFTPAFIDARGVPMPATGTAAARIQQKWQHPASCVGLGPLPPPAA